MTVTVARIPYVEGVSPCAMRNAAIRGAGTPWVFLLDFDAHPDSECLAWLLARARSVPSCALVAPRIIDAASGRIHYDAGWPHFLAEMCLQNRGLEPGFTPPPGRRPLAAGATALLLRREAALKIGLFDDDYVFYKEDLDFCLRLAGAGYRIVHEPKAVVHHRPRPLEETGPRDLHRRRTYFQTKNRWRTLFKHCQTSTLASTLPLQLAYEAVNLAAAASRGEAGQALSAYHDLAMEWDSLLRSRRRCRAARVVPDSRLFGAPPLAWRDEVLRRPGGAAAKALFDTLSRKWWDAVRRPPP